MTTTTRKGGCFRIIALKCPEKRRTVGWMNWPTGVGFPGGSIFCSVVANAQEWARADSKLPRRPHSSPKTRNQDLRIFGTNTRLCLSSPPAPITPLALHPDPPPLSLYP
ncbi:unnamed protein product, partial [Pylaiella littoralis]